MTNSHTQILENRKLVRIGGEEAADFLNGLITCDALVLEEQQAAFGALLSPQGKILFDFFAVRDEHGFLIDIDGASRDDFIKRLMFYRLRRKVEIGFEEEFQSVLVSWGDALEINDALSITDPRLEEAGQRHYCKAVPQPTGDDYARHRISLGLPEGGADFQFGDAFPHEALMDQFGGVDFQKGCYVGQEVVSRMQHRGTARKRILKIHSDSNLPESGTDVLAGGKIVGTLGSISGNIGLATLRLDRIVLAKEEGLPLMAGDIIIEAEIQSWAKFDWPVKA
ncbi:MAG: folate-binding protein YgfZ [Hyphomicrobiales bacterium]|nr:MAG: folate-binding protein YgfZ [Hyphomicrobiales bacterium]